MGIVPTCINIRQYLRLDLCRVGPRLMRGMHWNSLPSMEDTPLMTLEEVADLLRVSPETARRMAVNGELPGALPKIGNVWRVNRRRFMAGIGEPANAESPETVA